VAVRPQRRQHRGLHEAVRDEQQKSQVQRRAASPRVWQTCLKYWRPRGGSVIRTIASSLPPLVALIAAAV